MSGTLGDNHKGYGACELRHTPLLFEALLVPAEDTIQSIRTGSKGSLIQLPDGLDH
jgi:hypothetical protein